MCKHNITDFLEICSDVDYTRHKSIFCYYSFFYHVLQCIITIYYVISIPRLILELLCMYRPVNRTAILDLMVSKEMSVLYIISHHILAFHA